MSEYHPYRDWTKGMVFVGFVERMYNLPPGDNPVAIKRDDTPTYNTLAVTNDTHDIKDQLSALGGLWDPKAKMWLFQESADAPAASVHPPPADDDNPATRPKHRVFNVSKTVPVGTHDKLLYLLGGLQRCDLPQWLTPRLPLPKIDGDSNNNDTASAAVEEPRRKSRRTEAASNDGSPKLTVLPYSQYTSHRPSFPSVEKRIAGGANVLTGAVLSTILEARSATAKKGQKKVQIAIVESMSEHVCYATQHYRATIYKLVSEGEMPLVKEGDNPISATALVPAEAAKTLRWDANGNINV